MHHFTNRKDVDMLDNRDIRKQLRKRNKEAAEDKDFARDAKEKRKMKKMAAAEAKLSAELNGAVKKAAATGKPVDVEKLEKKSKAGSKKNANPHKDMEAKLIKDNKKAKELITKATAKIAKVDGMVEKK